MDAVESECLLFSIEKPCFSRGFREIPVGKDREAEGAGTFNKKEVAPAVKGGLDLEDAEGEEAGEGVSDVGCGVEDCETTGELSTAVEGGLVVDDEGKECRLSHAQEPSEGEEATEVVGGSGKESKGAETAHHNRESTGGTKSLPEHGKGGRKEDIWDEEDREEEIVLIRSKI